jgi:hypothetical protein
MVKGFAQLHQPCNFVITNHAVEQFMRRWAKGKSPEQAVEELATLLDTSKHTGKTPLGDTIVVSGYRPEVRMVVKDRNVCVTVLPVGQFDQAISIVQEEMKLIAEHEEGQRQTAQAEIAAMEQEIIELDLQRVAVLDTIKDRLKEISDKKHVLHNRIYKMRYKLPHEVE